MPEALSSLCPGFTTDESRGGLGEERTETAGRESPRAGVIFHPVYLELWGHLCPGPGFPHHAS